jgi:hypothetical protein
MVCVHLNTKAATQTEETNPVFVFHEFKTHLTKIQAQLQQKKRIRCIFMFFPHEIGVSSHRDVDNRQDIAR